MPRLTKSAAHPLPIISYEEGFFWLSETPDVPGTVFAGSGSIRLATWVVLRDVRTNLELFVINTHFDNVSQSSREQSESLIRTRLDALAGDRLVVLTGDLNQGEQNAAIQILIADSATSDLQLIDGYRQLFPVVQPDELTYHNFEGQTAGTRIDFILHDNRLVTVAADIRRDTFDGLYPSDHYPLTGILAYVFDRDDTPCF